jgi:hypothetical protein
MCPKSQKRDKNSAEPFESSAFYLLPEPSLAEPLKRFCRILYSFLRLWTPLETFGNLQNLFGGFFKAPFFRVVAVACYFKNTHIHPPSHCKKKRYFTEPLKKVR